MVSGALKAIDLPPVWLIALMALAWVIGRALPEIVVDRPILTIAGWALIAVGVGLMAWCALWFRRRRTSIVPRRTPDALITEGPYRISRNPIYLADALILTGWVLVLGAVLALVTVPLFVFIINRRFIDSEEAVLQETFGAQYDAWQAETRRWI